MILVDPRAGSSELIPILGDTCVATRLEFPDKDGYICPAGDICIPGNGPTGPLLVGVEVKKLPDLMSSIDTGGLSATQVPRLRDFYDEVYLLVVGAHRAGVGGRLEIRRSDGVGWRPHNIGKRPVPWGYLEAVLIELSILGVQVRTVDSNYEAAAWLGVLDRWWSKPWDKHRLMHKFDRRNERGLIPRNTDPEFDRKDMMARHFKELPKLGWERAWAATEVFPNLRTAYGLAGIDDWASVPGIGKVIAKLVMEAIDGK